MSMENGVDGLSGPISFLDVVMKNLPTLALVLIQKNVIILLSFDTSIRKLCLETCQTKKKIYTRFSI